MCEYAHYSCLLPLFRGATASIAVVGAAFYAGHSCVAVVSFVALAIAVQNKYSVLNTWCVTPCGVCSFTSWHLPSVRDRRELVGVKLFVLAVHRVHSFCSGPDQSGRIAAEGWVKAVRKQTNKQTIMIY